jgi:hypothetical protein
MQIVHRKIVKIAPFDLNFIDLIVTYTNCEANKRNIRMKKTLFSVLYHSVNKLTVPTDWGRHRLFTKSDVLHHLANSQETNEP